MYILSGDLNKGACGKCLGIVPSRDQLKSTPFRSSGESSGTEEDEEELSNDIPWLMKMKTENHTQHTDTKHTYTHIHAARSINRSIWLMTVFVNVDGCRRHRRIIIMLISFPLHFILYARPSCISYSERSDECITTTTNYFSFLTISYSLHKT